ncbi:hypothetical protein Taro_010731 [Colocasia esculenta]|uniref:Secreted protein n=1 Tax=Colocasia esculenta TaxID=4460 RepID=A0A843U3V5_COLES|nr:hypothetical protein [Colocasia esculenta]
MKWCVPLCLHGLWCGIPCEASACSREADSDQVRYRFNGLGRGVPPHVNYEWYSVESILRYSGQSLKTWKKSLMNFMKNIKVL